MPNEFDLSQLAKMPHADLYRLRNSFTPEEQKVTAPYEHRAFAREWMQESPWLAGPSLPFAIPAWQGAKAVGAQKARTAPDWNQLMQGYIGYLEGLAKLLFRERSPDEPTKGLGTGLRG